MQDFARIRFNGSSALKWRSSRSIVEAILDMEGVLETNRSSIVFEDGASGDLIHNVLEFLSEKNFNLADCELHGFRQQEFETASRVLLEKLSQRAYFDRLNLGPDVAEHEHSLPEYFLETDAYRSTVEGHKRIIVGPKGSGKSAIKRIVEERHPHRTILITPEHYAADVLKEVLIENRPLASKERAFAIAWKYTLLIEICKKVLKLPRIRKGRAHEELKTFMRNNGQAINLDLFQRLIEYIRRIEAVKLGKFEIDLKTTRLSKLYALEDLYKVLPALKELVTKPLYILIDELDQGWDNSQSSNYFIMGLFLAATELDSYHENFKCCCFIRGEIFSMASGIYGHMDKLRFLVEELYWDRESLFRVLAKRIAFSMKAPLYPNPKDIFDVIFDNQALGGEAPIDYLIHRTSMRPREFIQLLKLCHSEAVRRNERRISRSAIEAADGRFSKWKFEHICSEYSQIYQGLGEILASFQFKKRILNYESIENICIKSILKAYDQDGPKWLVEMEPEGLVQLLYDIGFIGVLSDNHEFYGFIYCYKMPLLFTRNHLEFQIHPGYWKCLSVQQ